VPPKLPAAARNAVGRSLLKQGLLEEVRPADVAQSWSQDEDAMRLGLRLTDAGFKALNLEHPVSNQGGNTGATDGATGASGHTVGHVDASTPNRALGAPGAAAQTSLRGAAAAVLEEWDDRDNQQHGLPEAIERLRAALAANAGPLAREAGRSP